MITVKHVHFYYDLVNFSGAPPVQDLLYPACQKDDMLILKIDEDDRFYFRNLNDNSTIYPGLEFSDKVLFYIEKML